MDYKQSDVKNGSKKKLFTAVGFLSSSFSRENGVRHHLILIVPDPINRLIIVVYLQIEIKNHFKSYSKDLPK